MKRLFSFSEEILNFEIWNELFRSWNTTEECGEGEGEKSESLEVK